MTAMEMEKEHMTSEQHAKKEKGLTVFSGYVFV